jgi:CheY-like chemotaxis protein
MSDALIIDDNRQTAESLRRMLELSGVPARLALTPAAGLTLMQERVPRVVFLDLSMPGVTGFEVLAYLRRDPALLNVPVVIVTSDDQPETKKRALASGAQALLVKPVTVDVLAAALQQLGIM